MKKVISICLLSLLAAGLVSVQRVDAAGVSASGGGTKRVGDTFNATVVASGATFDSFQGVISVSGNVNVISITKGNATFLPGKEPSNGGQFVGICSERNSLTIATIKLKATKAGTATVSVSNVKLAYKGSIVGSDGGSTSFKIDRALSMPAAPKISSATHPDQNTAYEATTVELSWEKESGVTGFSQVFDQTENTTPPAQANTTDAAATFKNNAVGTYYFHLRAQNADGWSDTAHYKITIKEPEAKIDETLSKPSEITVSKSTTFENDIEKGTLTGVVIKGKTEPDFTANIILDPLPALPEGKTFSVVSDSSGYFEFTADFPIRAGSYILTIQGQNDKILTPISDPIYFEIDQKEGGKVFILSESDRLEPIAKAAESKWYEKINYRWPFFGAAFLFLVSGGLNLLFFLGKKKMLGNLTKGLKIN